MYVSISIPPTTKWQNLAVMADTIECDYWQALAGAFFDEHELNRRPRLCGSNVALCKSNETGKVLGRAAAHLLGRHFGESGERG